MTLINAGTILSNQGIFALTIDAAGGLTNTGLIESEAGTYLEIEGNVSGNGALRVDGEFVVTGTVGSGVQVIFGAATAQIVLDQAGDFAGTIDALLPTDVIALPNAFASRATIVGSVLDIVLSGGGTLAYALSQASPLDVATIDPDGAGSEIVISALTSSGTLFV